MLRECGSEVDALPAESSVKETEAEIGQSERVSAAVVGGARRDFWDSIQPPQLLLCRQGVNEQPCKPPRWS